MTLPCFPDFATPVKALKEGITTRDGGAAYRVCRQQSDKLVLLASFAKKWLDNEKTHDRAEAIIADHNAKYSLEAGFLVDDMTTLGSK